MDLLLTLEVWFIIAEELQNVLNEQITVELWSANLYLSMSFYLEREGSSGMARWIQKQSTEEIRRAHAIAKCIIKREATPKVDKVDVVSQSWGNPAKVFEHVSEHERHVSRLTDKLVQVASEEKDNTAQSFLRQFIREQVEGRASVPSITSRLRKARDSAILFMDARLGERGS